MASSEDVPSHAGASPSGSDSVERKTCLLREYPRALDICGQAIKGAWGMSWHQKAMKGVEVCEKPGGADKRASIPGYPNEPALNP